MARRAQLLASAVSKAFAVIRLLRRSRTPLNLTEVARSVKIAPSTAHSLLAEMAAVGAVTMDDDKRYRLGPAMFYYGAAYVQKLPIQRAVWAELTNVADEFGVAAVIAIPWEQRHLILNVHRGAMPGVEVAFGGRVPLDAGAWGKAYFAWSGAEPGEKLHAYTGKAITDLKAYRAELERVRLQGYAVDVEEFVAGAAAIATAVTSQAGFEGIAALIAPSQKLDEGAIDAAGSRLASLASRASVALGDQDRVRILGDD
jgi:DNA-binding IclR family transcriptional regulator